MINKNFVIQGDSSKVMEHIPSDEVQLVFTSPPYFNVKSYSMYEDYGTYLRTMQKTIEWINDILEIGRFFVLNIGSAIVPRTKRQSSSTRHFIPFDLLSIIVNSGFQFIDDIIWVKPEPSSRHRNASFMQHRYPLAYKPNIITEYILVYRKWTDKLIDWNMQKYDKATKDASKVEDGYETSNVWHINPKSDPSHPAIFPDELCKRVIQYYSYKGDIVLDPFAGSGTVGRVAQSLGRKFILIEQKPEYCNLIMSRLSTMFDQDEISFFSSLKELTSADIPEWQMT